jgi:hypothetical protein
MAVFLDVASSLMIEAVSSSETSVNMHQTTWCYIPEDGHVHAHHCENLKSRLGKIIWQSTTIFYINFHTDALQQTVRPTNRCLQQLIDCISIVFRASPQDLQSVVGYNSWLCWSVHGRYNQIYTGADGPRVTQIKFGEPSFILLIPTY